MMHEDDINRELARITGETQGIEGLGQLSVMVGKMMDIEKEVADTENLLALLKNNLQHYKVNVIPGMMAELGLAEVKTADGRKLTIDHIVSCKFIPEVKLRALNWLSEHGFGPLIKTEVSLAFGKDSEQAVDAAVTALQEAGFTPAVDQTVHPSTLRAWAKRQVEDGGAVPDDIFDINVFSMVKVK